MEEVWKSIKGYEGLYEISNLGNVRRYAKEKKCKNFSIYKKLFTKEDLGLSLEIWKQAKFTTNKAMLKSKQAYAFSLKNKKYNNMIKNTNLYKDYSNLFTEEELNSNDIIERGVGYFISNKGMTKAFLGYKIITIDDKKYKSNSIPRVSLYKDHQLKCYSLRQLLVETFYNLDEISEKKRVWTAFIDNNKNNYNINNIIIFKKWSDNFCFMKRSNNLGERIQMAFQNGNNIVEGEIK